MFCSMTGHQGSPDSRRLLSNQTSKPAPPRPACSRSTSLAVLAGVADENRGRLGGSRHLRTSRAVSRWLAGKGVPFLCELVHELDGIGHAKRLGLRTEILQKVAQVDVRNNCSVGDKFARLVAAVETVAASEPDKEPREPVRVGVADQKQALGGSLSKRLARRTDRDSSWSFQMNSSVSSSMSALSGIPEILPKR